MTRCVIQWFDMSQWPMAGVTQVLVYDSRTKLYRCVTVREDGLWVEESGRAYDPKFAPFYERWSPTLLREI